MTTMTTGQRLNVGTGGQFGDPTDEQILPHILGLLAMDGAPKMKPEKALEIPALREYAIGKFFEEEQRQRLADEKERQRLADEKEKKRLADEEQQRRADEASKRAEDAEAQRAMFSFLGISPEEQKRLVVTAWAKPLASDNVEDILDRPTVRKLGEDDTCGAPDSVGCCDHTEKVSVWAILLNGDPPYGLCPYLITIYDELYALSNRKAKVFMHSTNKEVLEARANHRREKEVPVRTFVQRMARVFENELPFIPEPKRG